MAAVSRGAIAVTPRSLSLHGHPALVPLEAAGFELVYPAPGRQPTSEEQLAVLPGCVGYLAGVEPIGRSLLERCPQLGVISRNGVGVDNVDLVAARELGIAVEPALGANAQGVAELAIALMLASLRSIPWSDQGLKAGAWRRREGREVRGRTLGVIGCGQIGQRVVKMGLGLGMEVVAYDVVIDAGFRPGDRFFYDTLDGVLGRADVISLHCPPGPAPLIDRDALSRTKPGAHLINTARAALVDHDEVAAALDDGRLSGFATDVYETEPPSPNPLLQRDRVIAMPHAGGFTAESVARATEAAVSHLLHVLAPDLEAPTFP